MVQMVSSDKSGGVVMAIDVVRMVIGDGGSDSGYRGWGNEYGDVDNNQNYESDTVAIIVGSGNKQDNDDWSCDSWSSGWHHDGNLWESGGSDRW